MALRTRRSIILFGGICLLSIIASVIVRWYSKSDEVVDNRSPEEHAALAEANSANFNDFVRRWLILGLLFVVLDVAAFGALRYFRDTEAGYGEEEVDLPMWLCAAATAVTLGSILLLPFSIAANQILLSWPGNYYVQWLNLELVFGMWNVIFVLSNVSLFVLVPFAYFYYEAEGIGKSHSVTARLAETGVVVVLVLLLTSGILYLLLRVLQIAWENLFPFAYSLISSVGGLVFLVSTSMGLYRILHIAGEIIVPFSRTSSLVNEAVELEFSEAALEAKLQMATKPAVREALERRLREVRGELARIRERRDKSPLLRSVLFFTYTTAALAFSIAIVVRSLYYFWGKIYLMMGWARDVGPFEFGKTETALGAVGALVEIGAIVYLMLATVIGMYNLPLLHRLRPRKHATSVRVLIANTALLLTLGSALPVVARVLDLTTFDLMGYYSPSSYFGGRWVVLSYNLLFLTSILPSVIALIYRTLRGVFLGLRHCYRSVCAWWSPVRTPHPHAA